VNEMSKSRFMPMVSDVLNRLFKPASADAPAEAANLLRDVARALDRQAPAEALVLLRGLLPDLSIATNVELCMLLWRNALSANLAANSDSADIAMSWMDAVQRALHTGDVWPVLRDFDRVAASITALDAAQVMVGILRGPLASADSGLKSLALVLVLDADNRAGAEALLVHLLATDPGFVPGVWQVQALMRLWAMRDEAAVSAQMTALLARASRPDLDLLWSILRRLIRQSDPDKAMSDALKLTDSGQRAAIADYLTGAAQHPDRIERAVELHTALAPVEAVSERCLMQARLAVSNGDWPLVLDTTSKLLDHPGLNLQAVCLRAMALAMTNDHDNASAAVRHVRQVPGAPWFLRGRAALISVTLRAARSGASTAITLPAPALVPGPGRPLAQSLWVGPSLRWIEQMSMQSFLRNGWRYKLYVYDEPAGVPDGVELADAAAILPRDAVFREGSGSGAHRGSLGAFSDLFRYALLARRGGFWTDTDVINLDLFDPEGVRLVASEWTDAGLIGPNGAQMAAPANDPLQRAALAAAEELREGDDLHFARIGPELLAELLAAGGAEDYALMHPHFLNPIGWMQTGQLLAPFDAVRGAPCFAQARSIHVYTETWRLIGLDLGSPPPPGSFLGTLRARLAQENTSGPNLVRNLMAKS